MQFPTGGAAAASMANSLVSAARRATAASSYGQGQACVADPAAMRPSALRSGPTLTPTKFVLRSRPAAPPSRPPLRPSHSHPNSHSPRPQSRAVTLLATKLIARDINYRQEFEAIMETFGAVFPKSCLENFFETHAIALPNNRQLMILTLYQAGEDGDRVSGVITGSHGVTGAKQPSGLEETWGGCRVGRARQDGSF